MSDAWLDRLLAMPDVWQRLAQEPRPLVLYGMGDGADKLRDRLARRGRQVRAVFASDGFVRGQQYAGMRVQTLSQVEQELDDFVVVLAFASQRPEVMEDIGRVARRHPLVAPSVPVYGGGEWDRDYLARHRQEIQMVCDSLADDISRRAYADLIEYQLSGDIALLDRCATAKDEIFESVLRPGEQEHFVDLGAYTGDTVRELLEHTGGRVASVLAVEPDRRNARKLQEYIDSAGLSGCTQVIQAAAWSRDETLYFSARAGRQSSLGGDRSRPVEGLRVDSLLESRPVTYLKMDVEGAEEQVLHGAQSAICRWKPRLNIALYHRCEDLFALPLLVRQICPDYRLYVRHHPYYPGWDTNLYARAY